MPRRRARRPARSRPRPPSGAPAAASSGDRLQRYLTRGAVERAVRPLLAMEEFTAGG